MALFSTETKYITLIFVVKKVTWLWLFLIKLGFLKLNNQHVKINIKEGNSSANTLLKSILIQEGKNFKGEWQSRKVNKKHYTAREKLNLITPIFLRGDNQGSITLAHNSVFYSQIKYINIQYHYIRDKVVASRINLMYIFTDQIIINSLIKSLTHAKF